MIFPVIPTKISSNFHQIRHPFRSHDHPVAEASSVRCQNGHGMACIDDFEVGPVWCSLTSVDWMAPTSSKMGTFEVRKKVGFHVVNMIYPLVY